MMFCTTFLSAPSEELGDGCAEGCVGGGGGGVTPGGCLSTLHCLVLPQEELYAPLSSAPEHAAGASRLSLCHGERACGMVGKMLLEVNMAACGGQTVRCSERRRRSRSASPAPGKSPGRDRQKGRAGVPPDPLPLPFQSLNKTQKKTQSTGDLRSVLKCDPSLDML